MYFLKKETGLRAASGVDLALRSPVVALLVTGAGRSGAAPGRRGDCSSAVSELLLALVKNVAMWKEARGDRGNIHSPSVAEECRGEREEKREGREGRREGAKRDVHSPFASGELKEGKEISPKYLTLLKVLR